MPTTRQTIVLALAGFLLTAGVGCSPTPSSHGKDAVAAVYAGGSLTSTIPEPTSVEQVMAAADQMFRDRGYSVLSSATTSDTGKIVAVPPRENFSPRVVFAARSTPEGVRVDISVEPWGSRELSGNLLDGLLRRLGR